MIFSQRNYVLYFCITKGQPELVAPLESSHTILYTEALSMNCMVGGKPAFTSIHWDIPGDMNNIFKSIDLGSEPEGKLTRHTVRLEWNTEDTESRKTGNEAVLRCVANNGQGEALDESVTMDVQCKLSKLVRM